MYKKILVSIDDSERAFKALAHAARLAKASGAALFTLYIVKPDSAGGGAELSAHLPPLKKKLDEYLPGLTQENNFLLRQGKNIANIITATADELECDLIVLGSRRLPGARSVIARSVNNAVISLCQKPVLIV
ncbi:MAG: universal stress protein [Acidaminococcales bacterium]|nr:universal stress protein [Acidaminococcales bacterium]